jgi:hypothetical protein
VVIGDGANTTNTMYQRLAGQIPTLITLGSTIGGQVMSPEGKPVYANDFPVMHKRNDHRYTLMQPTCCTPTSQIDTPSLHNLTLTPQSPRTTKRTSFVASVLITLWL